MSKKVIELTKEQAQEMYYNINSYYLFLKCAESVDKTMFDRLKFWNSSMNNHLRRARQSINELMKEFNKRAISSAGSFAARAPSQPWLH